MQSQCASNEVIMSVLQTLALVVKVARKCKHKILKDSNNCNNHTLQERM